MHDQEDCAIKPLGAGVLMYSVSGPDTCKVYLHNKECCCCVSMNVWYESDKLVHVCSEWVLLAVKARQGLEHTVSEVSHNNSCLVCAQIFTI